jgi:hypothetical protein
MNNKQIKDIAKKAIDKFLSEYIKQCDLNKLAVDAAIAQILTSEKHRFAFEELIVNKRSDSKKILIEMEEGKVFDGEDSETLELIFSKLIPVSRTLERVLIEAFDAIDSNMPTLS